MLLNAGVFWTIALPGFIHGYARLTNLSMITRIRDFSLSVAYCYAETAVLGIPTLLFLRWRQISGCLGYTMAGFLVESTVAALLTILFAFSDDGTSFDLNNLWRIVVDLATHDARLTQMFVAPAAVYGTLTALIFWLISRPDLEAGAEI
jgi:hypothetical protein